MFKRVYGVRAMLLGVGGFVGIVAAWIGYADLARNFLPATVRAYWPLLMIAGFACALWAAGTTENSADPEPSIVVNYRRDYTEDDDTAEQVRHDYVSFQNVGQLPLTNLWMPAIDILGVRVRLSHDIPVLLPRARQTEVQLYSLGVALDKVRRRTKEVFPTRKSPIELCLPMTIHCMDWKQREHYSLTYSLTLYRDEVLVHRVHDANLVSWTDLDGLFFAVVGQDSQPVSE